MMKQFLEKVRAKNTQFGFAISYPAPGILERIGKDWDWVWIDGQHGQLAYQDVLDLIRVCELMELPAIARVPSHEPSNIGMFLDAGANGIIVPLVNTVEEAKAIVSAAKFPPLGERSFGGRRIIDRKTRDFSQSANEDTLLIAQIETPGAVENAEAIAAIEGIDALFLGPDDILLRRGVSMAKPRTKETLGDDMEAVSQASNNNGKFSVMPAHTLEIIAYAHSLGFNMLASGADTVFLTNGSDQASKAARQAIQDNS